MNIGGEGVSYVPFLPSLKEAEQKCGRDWPVGSRLPPGMRGPMYQQSIQEAPSGAAWPGDEPPIHIMRADFPPFGPKSGIAHLRWMRFKKRGKTIPLCSKRQHFLSEKLNIHRK